MRVKSMSVYIYIIIVVYMKHSNGYLMQQMQIYIQPHKQLRVGSIQKQQVTEGKHGVIINGVCYIAYYIVWQLGYFYNGAFLFCVIYTIQVIRHSVIRKPICGEIVSLLLYGRQMLSAIQPILIYYYMDSHYYCGVIQVCYIVMAITLYGRIVRYIIQRQGMIP